MKNMSKISLSHFFLEIIAFKVRSREIEKKLKTVNLSWKPMEHR